MKEKAYLLLTDGLAVEGVAIGALGSTSGEICFNTGMTGYQEIYTDPSYYGQIVVNTTPHIGNYGVDDAEQESEAPQIRGLVVSEFSEKYSRAHAAGSLQQYLEHYHIVGIAGVDTRMLVRHIREKGSMNAIISSTLEPTALAEELRKTPSMQGLELSSRVTTPAPYFVGDEKAKRRVAALDLGVKKSIIENLASRGVYCRVFPAATPFAEMEQWKPHAYLISNGPGDPSATRYAIDTVREILAKERPMMGICLGHQLLALACGVPTYKMFYGHRGLNHPVKNLMTGRGEITSQNHGFSIEEGPLKNHDTLEVTHVHLNDNTIMGLRTKNGKAFSVQYHPEASPGPHDARYLFDQFVEMIDAYSSP